MPNTFSQAMRYSGTIEKANTNDPAETSAIVRNVFVEDGCIASSPSVRDVAVREVAVADHRRHRERVVRGRRRHGPLEALGAFPDARGRGRAAARGLPDDV